MKYIIAIGIFQALLATVLLFRGRLKRNADDFLILLIVCIGLHLSIKFVIFTFVKDIQVLNMMNTFVGFCYLPLLYLYAKKIIDKDFIPASRWYVFIPFIIGTIGYFSTVSVLIAAPEAGHQLLYWYNTVSLWTILSFGTLFSLYVIYLVKNRLDPSNEKKLIMQIAYLFLAIDILGCLFAYLHLNEPFYNYLFRSITYTVLVIICIRIITYRYFAFTYSEKNTDNEGQLSVQNNSVMVTVKSKDDNFSENELNEISEHTVLKEDLIKPQKRKELLSQSEMFKILLKLESAMKTERYYTDSDLTLDKLSALTNQNKYHISETLNHFVHKPFYTFVNEYRIQYVKDRLMHLSKTNNKINLLELAYESGFNSKSSFNRYFKEITSHTPTVYLNLISEPNEADL